MRECGDCTACCDGWLEIEVDGVQACAGTPCPRSTGKGCNDYSNRPDQCRTFSCAWREGYLLDWMRPDKAKVIVIRDKPKIGIDTATPVGKRIPPRALNVLSDQARRDNRPLVYSERGDGFKCFGPRSVAQYAASL